MKRHRISSLVGPRTRVAAAVAATLAWCAVYAQEQPAAAPVIQEVTVTGTRIQGITNANTPAPSRSPLPRTSSRPAPPTSKMCSRA